MGVSRAFPGRRSHLGACRDVQRRARRKRLSSGSSAVPAPSTSQSNGMAAYCRL